MIKGRIMGEILVVEVEAEVVVVVVIGVEVTVETIGNEKHEVEV